MIGRRVPGAVCIANRDRPAGAREAIGRGCDVIVADDAFQHRRLGRDLDIVLIDATNPFGFERLLPAGLLREPLSGLARADLIVVSRIDLVGGDVRDELFRRLDGLAPGVPCVACGYRISGISDLNDSSTDERFDRAVLAVAIGNPEAFRRSIERIGIEPAACLWWRDHHRYGRRDAARVESAVRETGCDVVLTTEKDAVKWRGVTLDPSVRLRVVRIVVEYVDDGEDMIESVLADTLRCRKEE